MPTESNWLIHFKGGYEVHIHLRAPHNDDRSLAELILSGPVDHVSVIPSDVATFGRCDFGKDWARRFMEDLRNSAGER